MKRKSTYVFLATALMMLVLAPGRFVYGFVLVVELNFIVLMGTLSVSLVKKLKLDELQSVTVLFLMLAATVLYREIIILMQPEIVLTLGFLIYVIPLSFYSIGYVFSDTEKKLSERLNKNMIQTLIYSVFALLFFLVRDIFGYGTFTFFGTGHQIYEKVIIKAERTGLFSIIASVPGALIFSAILLSIHSFYRNRTDIVKKAEESK